MCCLIAFIVTFFVTRTIVRYIRAHADSDAPREVVAAAQHLGAGRHGMHIHHVVIGVVLVMMSGVTMVTLAVDGGVPEFTVAAIVFGIGAALVLDEFALILHLQDVYWSEDGRTSVDAVFAAVAVAGLLILGFNPLSFFDISDLARRRNLAARASVVALAVLTLMLAVVVLLKGKVWTGSGRDVHHPVAVRRRDPAVAAARAVGALALHRQAEEDAPRAGTGRRMRRPLVQAKLWLQSVHRR